MNNLPIDTLIFLAAQAEGQQMSMEQVLALARENQDEESPLPKSGAE